MRRFHGVQVDDLGGNPQIVKDCGVSVPGCFSPVLLFVTPWTIGFSRHKYWSGLPFPSPGDLPHPGIKPSSSAAPALAGGCETRPLTSGSHKLWCDFLWDVFVHLLLKFNWPTTLYYFLVHTIVIQYFHTFQNSHCGKSSYNQDKNLLPNSGFLSYWLELSFLIFLCLFSHL